MDRPLPERAVHGGLPRTEQHEEGWLDFSANLNPFAPHLEWTPNADCLRHYPDDRYPALKEAIARTFGRRPEEITVGNGSIEVIRSFCRATLGPGDRVLIDHPTFGEYGVAAALSGASPTDSPRDATVRFLCNPNNPTGALRAREEVDGLLGSVPEGGRLFLDEAFIELADPGVSMVGSTEESLFVLRSMTKAFAVPGIRIGFGFGHPDLVERCERCRTPWSVNAFAEEFAIAALAAYPELEASRAQIRIERDRLGAELVRLGLSPLPGAANFLCAESPVPVPPLCEALGARRIRIRDCASFGLPDHIRVAVRSRDENRRLIEGLEACLA